MKPAELTFLDGKVRKRSLPVLSQPAPRSAGGPARIILAQGELANFYDADEGVRYLAFLELKEGTVRGNHLHRVKEEQLYLVSGELLLVAQAGQDGARISLTLLPGDLVEIATGVAHAFKPVRTGYAVEFSKTRFDPSDSERVTLI